MSLIAAAAGFLAVTYAILRAMLLIPGANRPDNAPPQSSGLFHTWWIRMARRRNTKPADTTQPAPTAPNLTDHETATIQQHVEAALRG